MRVREIMHEMVAKHYSQLKEVALTISKCPFQMVANPIKPVLRKASFGLIALMLFLNFPLRMNKIAIPTKHLVDRIRSRLWHDSRFNCYIDQLFQLPIAIRDVPRWLRRARHCSDNSRWIREYVKKYRLQYTSCHDDCALPRARGKEFLR